jgi:hypothetical protein
VNVSVSNVCWNVYLLALTYSKFSVNFGSRRRNAALFLTPLMPVCVIIQAQFRVYVCVLKGWEKASETTNSPLNSVVYLNALSLDKDFQTSTK